MRCPKCHSTDFKLNVTCAHCHFTGDVPTLERFSNITFLLAEMDTWPLLPFSLEQRLRQQYQKQQRQAEVALQLRLPPPTAAEAEPLRAELAKWQAAATAVAHWRSAGHVNRTVATYIEEANGRIANLQERLLDAPELPLLSATTLALNTLAQKRFVLETAVLFHKQKHMRPAVYQAIVAALQAEMAALEVEAGLAKPPPAESEEIVEKSPDTAAMARPEHPASRFKRPAITWDRVWETLLSERTLQAILFLGVLLLFAAGISWVAWNWDTFPAVVQMGFLFGFTAAFYGLGWFVHQRLKLYGSGIALIAVGSLLAPLDFYALYLSGTLPPASWPAVWWLASAVCLAAYLLTAVLLQAPFFGYLIGIAAGSLALASMSLAGVPRPWWQTGVAGTALALVLLGEWLPGRARRWRFLARPFGHIALAGVIPALALGLGWGFLGEGRGLFHTALAVDWWLGGFVLALMVRHTRLRSLAWAAALAFPIATWLTQRVIFISAGVSPAWYALGWALLLPLYLLAGQRWQQHPQTAVYGRIVLRVAALLTILCALWSLQAVQAAAAVHMLLAGVLLLAAVLWQRPRPLWGMSLFLLTASIAWQGGRGATPAELILPWALLSILHMMAALRLGYWSSTNIPIAAFAAPLFGAAYILAGLTLLPPLLLNDRPLLAYALAHWMGANVWLAYLAHLETAGVLPLWGQQRPARLATLYHSAMPFHWGAAMATVPWVWLLWTNGRAPSPALSLLYTAVAWGLLWVAARVWDGGRAWQTAAHLNAAAALAVAVGTSNQVTLAWLLLPLAGFYLVAAWSGQPQVIWAYLGVWLGVAGAGLLVEAYSRGSGRSAALAALAAIVLVLAERGLYWLTRQRGGEWRLVWQLYRRPLYRTGWLVSLAALVLALGRNLVWLGGGPARQTWTIVALLLLVGLYAAGARLYRQERFAWFAALLAPVPWTLLMYRGWYVLPAPTPRWYGVGWLELALALAAIAMVLRRHLGPGWWTRPWLVAAHLLAPAALLWGCLQPQVSVVALALGLLFYGAAVWQDAHFREKGAPAPARFLYPALFLLPLWAAYIMAWLWPEVTATAVGLLALAFALPLLAAGWAAVRLERAYGPPFYMVAYTVAAVGTLLVAGARPVLIGALLFDVGLAVLSVWLFRQPRWWYVAALALPLAGVLLLAEWGVSVTHVYGWLLIGLGGLYLGLAWELARRSLDRYGVPLLQMMFFSVAVGLGLCSGTQWGALVGYGLAAAIWTAMAVWQGQPLLFHLAVALAVVPYVVAWQLLGVGGANLGVALWPGILLALLLARRLDAPPDKGESLPPVLSMSEWWAWSLYLAAFMGATVSAALTVTSDWRWLLVLLAGSGAYSYGLFRFRRRLWLLLAWGWLQLAALALIRWLGWVDSPAQLALAFLPMTVLTAVAGVVVERQRAEEPLFMHDRLAWAGWSRPFYLLLGVNLVLGQLLALSGGGAGTAVTFGHMLLLAVLATQWSAHWPAAASLGLGVVALGQFLAWRGVPFVAWPAPFALLALAYGVPGGWLRLQPYKQQSEELLAASRQPPALVWMWPLYFGGWLLSAVALYLAVVNVRAGVVFLNWWFRRPWLPPQEELLAVQGFLLALAIAGLFYLMAALVERWRWLGYGAVLLLLAAWCGWLLLLAEQAEMQLYAIPAGFYLLGVGWAEWVWGNRALARWIDRAALLLLFGAAFWQSFGPYGGVYALLMLVEGLAIAWFGSMRRLRRLLYGGMAGVLTAVAGQLIEPLLSANTYVLLLLGGFLVALGIVLERRLEKVRSFSKEVRTLLEHWE